MNQKTITKDDNKFITIKNKDIFQIISNRISSGNNGATVIVPHVCNNINGFGAGFAGQIAQYFPDVKENFHMLGNKPKLGKTQFVVSQTNSTYKHSIVFANMIAQNGIISKNNPRPINYAALVYCMMEIKSYMKIFEKNNDNLKIEIHAPKFGSGLAGGNWNFISNLIDDIWGDSTVFIYEKK